MLENPERSHVLPRWIAGFFVTAAIVLIPWIAVLFTSLHEGPIARHWRLVWGGFDTFLMIGFAVTAYRVLRRSPRGAITAAATGTMLLVDAWFDILTARRASDQLTAVLMAVFAEIPCALICFYVARRIIGLFEQARPYLAEAGVRVVGGRLLPPTGSPAAVASSAEDADSFAEDMPRTRTWPTSS